MTDLVEQVLHAAPPAPAVVEIDEAAARRSLRGQVAHLERQLASAAAAAWPRVDLRWTVEGMGGPRLLSLGELEALRDDLAVRVGVARRELADREEAEAGARLLLDRMLSDPPAHKWARVTNAQLGQPGCTTYEVRPRLGLLGMAMGWWRVKVSSGCPLPGGPRPSPRPPPH